MSKPNFTARPVAPAPTAGLKHDPNGPPLRQGAYVAEDTANQLKMVGWNPGDPVPAGLADVVAEVAAKYRGAQEEVAAVGSKQRLKPVRTVRMEDLPPAAREEITAFVKQAAALNAATVAQEAARTKYVPPNASDSVRSALEQAALREAGGVTLLDEDEEDEAPAQQEPPQAAPQATDTPAPTAPAEQLPVLCPRCNHDMRQPHDVIITDEDIMSFAAAILDPLPSSRFRKRVSLMGGKLLVVFRDLTTRESKLAATQTRQDAVDGKISGEVECYVTLMEYRMAMSIESISDARGAVLAEIPPVFDIPIEDADKPYRLARLLEFMDETAYPKESTKRTIAVHFRQFQRLVAELEAKAADPDFCQGIATQLSW